MSLAKTISDMNIDTCKMLLERLLDRHDWPEASEAIHDEIRSLDALKAKLASIDRLRGAL